MSVRHFVCALVLKTVCGIIVVRCLTFALVLTANCGQGGWIAKGAVGRKGWLRFFLEIMLTAVLRFSKMLVFALVCNLSLD